MDENHNSHVQRRAHLTKEQRLPQYLKEVEKVIRSAKSCQSNFKSVLANSRLRGNFHKKVYSLTVNVLKYYNYIQKIIERLHLLEKETFLRREIASILIYEMIFGKNNLPGKSKIITIIWAYQKDIMDAHEELQNSSNFISKELSIPRYVRVHTLVTTVPYVIKDLESYGFKHIEYDDLSEDKYLEQIKNLKQGHFLIDFHFKDILVFASNENLTPSDLYKNGHIFLQDKASYIPVHVLNPEPGCAVLDACAAPGMKTVHIASKMKNTGILIACERDKERFEGLKEMLQHGAVKICKTLCKDFKLLDPNNQAYSSIEYILLDPSCSGSGMVSRMDEVTDTEDSKNKERLMKLAGFQIILLKHALRFPSVKKVVYSTCSVNEEENEYVVHEALSSCYGEFKLVPVMPEWPVRGSENFEFGNMCLRTVPEKHLTNGFFVAMFERINNDEDRKRVHLPKNKKNDINNVTDTQYEDNNKPVFKTQGKNKERKWENSNEKKKISEMSKHYFAENNYNDEKHLLDSNKGIKLESCQEPGDNSNENDCNSTASKIFKKKVVEYSDENMKKVQVGKERDFSNTMRNKTLIGFPNASNEVIQETLASTLSVSQECLIKESTLPFAADGNLNISTVNKKHKHKRHFSSKIMSNVIQITDECPSIQSKKSEVEKIDENLHNSENRLSASIQSDCVTHKKNKKRKRETHEIEKIEDFETIHDTNNSEEIFMSPSTQLDCVTNKKNKKNKSKRHKTENNNDFEKIEDFETLHETSINNSEDRFMSASTQLECVTNKKNKKHKSKRHKTENTNDFEIVNENFPNSENTSMRKSETHEIEKIEIQNDCEISKKIKQCKYKKHETEKTDSFEREHKAADDSQETFTCATIQNNYGISKRNKKCKSKKQEVEKADFEIIQENLPYDFESMLMCTSIQSDCVTSKKHKSKKHENGKTDDSERTFVCASNQNDCVTTKKNIKHKSKKKEIEKTGDLERIHNTAANNLEETFMCDEIQSDCAIFSEKNKKCRSKKQEIEKADNFEIINENFPHSSENTLNASIHSNDVTHRKKKHKSKKHKIQSIDDSESTFVCASNQSDSVIPKKNKSEKHKIEKTEDFETIHDTNNSEDIFMSASTQLDCVTSKKNKKHKSKRHKTENANDFEIIGENLHNSEQIFMSTPTQNDCATSKESENEIEKSDDFKIIKETDPCNSEGVKYDFLSIPHSEEELQNILFKNVEKL